MKKFFLVIAAVVMTAGALSAQDINQATENYNNGAMELQMGNNSAALENFLSALTMGEALGDEGADLVTNCKKAICSAYLSMAKDLYNAKDFEGALTAFQQAKEFARATDITSLAVTKLDGTAKGGVVIGVVDQFHVPVKFVGVGEGIDDLKVFDKREFVSSLFSKEDIE